MCTSPHLAEPLPTAVVDEALPRRLKAQTGVEAAAHCRRSKGCLRGAMLNQDNTRLREQTGANPEPAPIFAPASEPDERAFREALGAALGEIPVDQRAVVHLKLWEGLTFEQIAELLGIPLNTAASRYRYGLDKLRERLRPLYDEIR